MPERKIQYEVLDHKADTGFCVCAPSWERLFIDAALAMTDMRVSLDLIRAIDKKSIAVAADEKDVLMVSWLNEVLFLFEKEKFLCKRVIFQGFDLKKIQATLFGETYIPLKHGSVSEIKAATYHQLELGERQAAEPEFYAKVFLDL